MSMGSKGGIHGGNSSRSALGVGLRTTGRATERVHLQGLSKVVLVSFVGRSRRGGRRILLGRFQCFLSGSPVRAALISVATLKLTRIAEGGIHGPLRRTMERVR